MISELRAGAPFPVVAAQFSQTQTALQGGELGWVQPNQLDPEVARLVSEMPPGAVSNPVKVPGGFSIVTLQGKREIGNDVGTAVSLRQVFLPFTSALNPQAPTDQQRQRWTRRAASAPACTAASRWNRRQRRTTRRARPTRAKSGWKPSTRRRFARCWPPCRSDRASQPLVTNDGIAVLIVCSREQKNLAQQSAQEVRAQLLNERVELLSRQLLAQPASPRHDRHAHRRCMTVLPPLREVIARHGLAAGASLGQHFLLDANLTQRIVREAGRWTAGMSLRSARVLAG